MKIKNKSLHFPYSALTTWVKRMWYCQKFHLKKKKKKVIKPQQHVCGYCYFKKLNQSVSLHRTHSNESSWYWVCIDKLNAAWQKASRTNGRQNEENGNSKNILVWLPWQQENSNYIRWFILAGCSLLVLINFEVDHLSEILFLLE